MSRTLIADPITGEIRPSSNDTRSTDYEEWANFHGTTNWDTHIQYPDYPGTGNWGDPTNDYNEPIGPNEAPEGWIMYPGGAGPEVPSTIWDENNPSPYDIYMNHIVQSMPQAPEWWNFPGAPNHPPGGMWGDDIMNIPAAPIQPPGGMWGEEIMGIPEAPHHPPGGMWGEEIMNIPAAPTFPPGGMWGDEIMGIPEAPHHQPGGWQNPPGENPNYINYDGIIPIAPPGGFYDGLVPVPPPDRPEGPNAWHYALGGKS